MSLPPGATLRGCGEAAVVVEFGETIDPAAGRAVARLAALFDTAQPAGLVEVVPTFRSLLVVFDPDATDADALFAALPQDLDDAAGAGPTSWRLPVAMEGEAAEDIEAAAQGLGLSVQELRETFLSARYQVGMYGFAPGFAYLSGVPDALAIPRRATPRPPMPAGSLILAGGMAALAPLSMPTGWYVIGRTAITMFRPHETPMVPIAVGDTIEFAAVTEAECARLGDSADGGLERIDP